MELELRMKYLERVYERYRKVSKESRGKILDELCHVCGYNRKYAIWKLSQLPLEDRPKSRPKRRRPKRYGHEVLLVVQQVWEVANYPWSVRLKEILRLWLPWIRLRYGMSPEVEKKLLSVSPSTIDRYLRDKKRRLRRRLYGRTKPGTLLLPQDSCQDRLLGCEGAWVYGGRFGLSLWWSDSGRVHLFAQPDRYLFRLGGDRSGDGKRRARHCQGSGEDLSEASL